MMMRAPAVVRATLHARAAARTGRRAAGSVFTALAAIGDGRLHPPADARTAGERLRAVSAALCELHDITAEIRGRIPDGPCVIVANHTSYLDALILAQLAPCAAIAKHEVARWPVIGNGARALGVIYVDRTSVHSGARALRQALRVLAGGVALLTFPEGTTSAGDRVLPFKRGIFGAARLARVPIIPVALRWNTPGLAWTGGARFLPHYLRTASRLSVHASIEIGRPIRPHPRDEAEILAEAARHDIAAMLGGQGRAHVRNAQRSVSISVSATLLVDPAGTAARTLEPAERLRVSAPRPDAVLPPAAR